MEEDYTPDNIIQWIFEKAFDQLTLESNELFETPFEKINSKTFASSNIYVLINKLTNRPIDKITAYLSNKKFQEKFLFSKIKKKLYVQILFGNLEMFKCLVQKGHIIDNKCLQLAVLNNRMEILEYIIDTNPKIKLNNELLMYCAEFGYVDIYFYLREKNLLPNISIYNKAVLGNSLEIIKDINEHIGISSKTLTTAFQTNNNSVILFLYNVAIEDKINLDRNLITYPILNNNLVLLEELDKINPIEWHHELYFSAILSGSMDMIKFMELKFPNIHDNHILDTSKVKKGRSSLLLEEIIYEKNNKKYFSHTINYAVQSGSIEMVKYIYSKDYGITISNIITAIKQGTCEILEYLCKKYNKKLPIYIIHYFGTNSYVLDKINKAKILIDSGLFEINCNHKLNINDYRKESTHLEIISQKVQVSEDGIMDCDYLMKYQLFFVPIKGYKLNHRLLTKTRICLELNIQDELINIFMSQKNVIDQQFIIDTLFLFGNMEQIKKLHPLIQPLMCPSQQIIMEIMCYCQLNKLCYLMINNILNRQHIDTIYPVSIMLSDFYLNLFFEKFDKKIPDIKYVIESGNKNEIIKWIDRYGNENMDKDTIKRIMKLEYIDILKKINIPKNILQELISWSNDSDLLEIKYYLTSLCVI
ncbi:ankyrin repeat protein [Tupanvirus soda lake]|uniref:Ankyrin repeat protein n=2 Tax=Tupanvirus TaxID=2094720 RepID=A0A6N1P0U2_9VIRU|nr:ankyrin repeat protein [Tupanvirus soda lake]QKU35582.1 ankyrin repeat protein [Tupanvirus soda lake]